MASDAGSRYRFDHHLVRDAVYNCLLKRARATMHIEFVNGPTRSTPKPTAAQEFEAILGYHLEQAYRYLGELGPLDESGAAIGRDGARRLASAARRAFGRGDMLAATNLFRRAAALLSEEDPTRVCLLPELGEVLIELGSFAEAQTVLVEAEAVAGRHGNRRIAMSAKLFRMRVRLFSAEPGDLGEATLRMTEEAIPIFESEEAQPELARAWRLIGLVHGIAARYGQSTDAITRSMTHARLAGDERLIARNATAISSSTLLGPTPVTEAIEICNQLMAGELPDRQAESKTLCTLAQLHAMNGDFSEARQLYRRARALLHDLGQGLIAAGTGIDVLIVELLAGDLVGAEQEVMADYQFLSQAGETYRRSTLAALLSRVIRNQGRDEEAMEFSIVAETISAEDDVDSQALWRSVRAPMLARAGKTSEAESMARSAVDLLAGSDAPQMRADTLSELAAVLAICGRPDEARKTISDAIAIYRLKGDIVSSRRAVAWSDQIS